MKSKTFTNVFSGIRVKLFSLVLMFLLAVNLVYSQSYQQCADPSNPVYSGGKWWIFTTGQGIYTMSNTSLTGHTGWTSGPMVFSGKGPSWIQNYVSGSSGFAWAPCFNGNDVYYAISTFGSKTSVIGKMNGTPGGTYTDKGMVVYSNSSSTYNAIDPYVFNNYLIYGSYFGGICICPLSNTGSKTCVATGDCEGGAMTSSGGYYYLWFNRGSCCKGTSSTYHVQVGRSTSITGPFLDKNGKNCNGGGGSDILVTSGRYIGPGGVGFNGSNIVYFFYDGNNGGNPSLMTGTVSYSGGWPVVASAKSAEEISDVNTIETDNSLTAYPNPISDEFTLRLEAKTASSAEVNVYDIYGKQIYEGDLGKVSEGVNEFGLNASKLNMTQKGIYLLKLKTGNKTQTVRLYKD